MSKQMNEIKVHKMLMLGALAESGKLDEVTALNQEIKRVLASAADDELAVLAITWAYFDVMLEHPEMIES